MDTLPPFHRAALMLDMDGTLIDLAPAPDSVGVPTGLPDAIATLRDSLGGALAIVTGRPIETVDQLFGDAPGAVAGEHGGGGPGRAGGGGAPPAGRGCRTARSACAAGRLATGGRAPGSVVSRRAAGTQGT